MVKKTKKRKCELREESRSRRSQSSAQPRADPKTARLRETNLEGVVVDYHLSDWPPARRMPIARKTSHVISELAYNTSRTSI